MSETTPLNEWPVEKLYQLGYMIKASMAEFTLNSTQHKQFYQNKRLFLEIVEMAIKDAEEKLAELPFK